MRRSVLMFAIAVLLCAGSVAGSRLASAQSQGKLQLVTFGDSVTRGCCFQERGTDWPTRMITQWNASALIADNEGIGGQESGQVAVRMNAYAGKPQQTFAAAFTIPVSGSVNLEFKAGYEPCNQAGIQGPIGVNRVLLTTSVAGATYELSCLNSGGKYVATPTNYPPHPVAVPAGTAWLSVVPRITRDTCVNIEVGRNNFASTAQVKQDIGAMVAVATAQTSCWSVMTVLNSELRAEWVSGERYKERILPLNNWIKATYGDHVVDIRQALVENYDPSNPLDVQDHANGVPASSLRSEDNKGNTLSSPVSDSSTCAFSTATPLYVGGTIAQIGGELILITGGKNGAYICERGYAGSKVAAHPSGSKMNAIDWLHPGINETTAANPHCEAQGGYRCISDVYRSWLSMHAPRTGQVAAGYPRKKIDGQGIHE